MGFLLLLAVVAATSCGETRDYAADQGPKAAVGMPGAQVAYHLSNGGYKHLKGDET